MLIFIAVSVNIFISLKKTDLLPSHHSRAELNADQQKKLALKLESQGLSASSAIAWKEYLDKTNLENSEAALIWYRIGKLFQDDHAYENALENVDRNGASVMEVRFGDAETLGREVFDVVLANITRNTLVKDMPSYNAHLEKGGMMLVSGILTEDVQYVLNAAYQCGLSHMNTREASNWICLSFIKQ